MKKDSKTKQVKSSDRKTTVTHPSPTPERSYVGTTREDMRRDTYTPSRAREAAS